MFRKDANRSGTSTDKVTLPLKPAWTWKGQKVGGFSVVSTIAVRDGAAFFFSGPQADAKVDPKDLEKKKKPERLLVCVDLKTGTVRWTQPMKSGRLHPFLSEDIGPAVTPSGTVYALDFGISPGCGESGFGIKAFSADKGKLLDEKGIAIRNTLSRFFVREGHGEDNFLLHSTEKPDC